MEEHAWAGRVAVCWCPGRRGSINTLPVKTQTLSHQSVLLLAAKSRNMRHHFGKLPGIPINSEKAVREQHCSVGTSDQIPKLPGLCAGQGALAVQGGYECIELWNCVCKVVRNRPSGVNLDLPLCGIMGGGRQV